MVEACYQNAIRLCLYLSSFGKKLDSSTWDWTEAALVKRLSFGLSWSASFESRAGQRSCRSQPSSCVSLGSGSLERSLRLFLGSESSLC